LLISRLFCFPGLENSIFSFPGKVKKPRFPGYPKYFSRESRLKKRSREQTLVTSVARFCSDLINRIISRTSSLFLLLFLMQYTLSVYFLYHSLIYLLFKYVFFVLFAFKTSLVKNSLISDISLFSDYSSDLFTTVQNPVSFLS